PAATQLRTLSLHDALPIFEPATAKRGETITWKLTVELAPGWHTYPVNRLPKDGKFQQYTEIKFPSSPDVYFVGRVTDPSYRTERSEEHTSELQSRGHLVCR